MMSSPILSHDELEFLRFGVLRCASAQKFDRYDRIESARGLWKPQRQLEGMKARGATGICNSFRLIPTW